MKTYKIITTELHSTEYNVDAESANEAVQKVLETNDWNIIDSEYIETLKDRDSMHIEELED